MIDVSIEQRQIDKLAKSIREYNETIRVLKRCAKWIEDHKTIKPIEFYQVIEQLETWKKSKEWLIKRCKERIQTHEDTLMALKKEFKITRIEAEIILKDGLKVRDERLRKKINPSKRK